MAKVRIKTEIATPLGGIFHVRELFSRYMAPIFNKVPRVPNCFSFRPQFNMFCHHGSIKLFKRCRITHLGK